MPKAYLSAVVVSLALFSTGAAAADQIPVIELQTDSGSASVQQPYYAGSSGGNGEMLMLLQQLQDEVRSLRGMVEQQQYQIQRMEQDQRDRYRDLDRRISQGGQAPALNSTTAHAGASDASIASGTSAPLAPLPAADSTPTDAQAYQAAFALVRQKSFAKALQAFTDFIQLYPDSARVPNAYYWIGEVNLAEQTLEPAKVAFQKVVADYSEHRKASDATYKLGVIYHQMGDAENAKKMFLQTQSRYPDSSAAGLAQDYLKR